MIVVIAVVIVILIIVTVEVVVVVVIVVVVVEVVIVVVEVVVEVVVLMEVVVMEVVVIVVVVVEVVVEVVVLMEVVVEVVVEVVEVVVEVVVVVVAATGVDLVFIGLFTATKTTVLNCPIVILYNGLHSRLLLWPALPQMLDKFAEDDRIEQMNAQKRRMKQLEHKRAVELLLEDRRETFARDRVSHRVGWGESSSGG